MPTFTVEKPVDSLPKVQILEKSLEIEFLLKILRWNGEK